MRVILGLDAPTAGRATIGGQPYARLSRPLHQVGALLDAGNMHGARTARNHLLLLIQVHVYAACTDPEIQAATRAAFWKLRVPSSG